MDMEQQRKIAYEYGLVYSKMVTMVAKLKNPRLISGSLPLSELDILRQKAERIPQWYRGRVRGFDKKLSILEEAIALEVA